MLLKQSFPELGGLQNVLMNTKIPFENSEKCLVQVLHVNNNHWAALSCINNTISYYDSSNCNISSATECIIARLINLQIKGTKINVHVKDVAHQTGIVDCGLYAIAYITSVAYGSDPSTVVFCQELLRPHFVKCLEQNILTEFPVKQRRRRRPSKVYEILLYCICKMPDNGEKMVFCEQCEDWYHTKCLGSSDRLPEELNCKCGMVLTINE